MSALSAVSAFPTTDQFPNFTSTLAAPIVQASNGVTNAATFLPEIVSGSWVTINGTNLATATRLWRGDEFGAPDFSLLPLSVASVSVTIDGKPAAVYYISPGQINVQAPSDTNIGAVSVVVTHDGESSPPVEAQLVSASPGWLTFPSGASVFAAAVHLNGQTVGDPSVYPTMSPARAGEQIAIFGTGFTSSPAGLASVPVVPLAPLPTVTIGGTAATVSFAGLTGVGLFQVNLTVPALPPGLYPAIVSWGGATSPANVQILVGN